jgi:hypothetical protein
VEKDIVLLVFGTKKKSKSFPTLPKLIRRMDEPIDKHS